MNTTRQPLPPDCLLGGKVHPSIAERLERIQQLPVFAVTNYLGLERDGDQFFLTWQALDATPMEQMPMSDADRAATADAVRSIVAAMHNHGIVHGAISPTTVLITRNKRIVLTGISPLLYDDPKIDWDAIDAIAARRDPPVETAEPLTQLRHAGYRSAALIAIAGLLMFFGLLWYSQHR